MKESNNYLVDVCRSYFLDDEEYLSILIELDESQIADLIFESNCQGIAPLILYTLLNSESLRAKMSGSTLNLLNQLHRTCAHRSIYLKQEALKICEVFNRLKIKYSLRKGFYLEYLAYPAVGSRHFGDVDFLVDIKDRDLIEDAMFSLNFEKGQFSEREGKFRKFDRREKLRFSLSPDHLERYAKEVDDFFIRGIEVDFAIRLDWHESPYSLLASDILPYFVEEVFFDKKMIQSMNLVEMTIDVILHTFRECYLESSIRDNKSAILKKFLDPLLMLKKLKKTDLLTEFEDKVAGRNLAGPFGFVAGHCEDIFNISLNIDYDRTMMNQWLAFGSETRFWNGNMSDRLFSKDQLWMASVSDNRS